MPVQNASQPRFATAEYPVLTTVEEPSANCSPARPPSLRAASFISRVRTDGRTLARLFGRNISEQGIVAHSVSPGFDVILSPERTRYRDGLILGLQVRRTEANAGNQCVVRFACGTDYVHATVYVPS